jgi:biopolymer transport protein ExbD
MKTHTTRSAGRHGLPERHRVTQSPLQIQITPLVDVLLVLLVLGLLAWAGNRAGSRVVLTSEPAPAPLPGLSLPLRHAADAQRASAADEKALLIGLGLHGHLSWRGTPVTRDILEQQLRQALEHDAQADVWLAADEALPYADLLPWLEWLQARQVSRLTLLTRSPSSARMSGKP